MHSVCRMKKPDKASNTKKKASKKSQTDPIEFLKMMEIEIMKISYSIVLPRLSLRGRQMAGLPYPDI